MAGEKKTISDARLKSELIKHFEKGQSVKTELCGIIRNKFKMGTDRFRKVYDVVYAEWQTVKDKATDEHLHESTKDELKSGLKTKLEWVGVLQKELDDNQVEESVLDLKTGKVIRYMRKMTPTERKGHMERISKFMGMDAAVKQDIKINPIGTDVEKDENYI